MKVPRISICIPALDRLESLREAVPYAQAQSVPDLEILIGDDDDRLLPGFAERLLREVTDQVA